MFLKKLIITFIGILSATIAFATVNINTASVEQLQQVRYIGPVKAKNIVAYRKEHGNFKSINDLTQVHGIGEKLLAKVKNELSVSGTTTNSTKSNNKTPKVTDKKEDKAEKTQQISQDKTDTKNSKKSKKTKKSRKKSKQ